MKTAIFLLATAPFVSAPAIAQIPGGVVQLPPSGEKAAVPAKPQPARKPEAKPDAAVAKTPAQPSTATAKTPVQKGITDAKQAGKAAAGDDAMRQRLELQRKQEELARQAANKAAISKSMHDAMKDVISNVPKR